MKHQPIPSVNDSDVERIARRDFGEAMLPQVLSLLDEYGKQSWNTPSARVRLAILKLANGDIDKLRHALDVAITDYRDVLTAAEYPRYNIEALGKVEDDKLTTVIDDDWSEYRKWFESP